MEEFKKEFDSAYDDFMNRLTWMRGSCMDSVVMEREQDKMIARCNEIYKKYCRKNVEPKQMEEYMHLKGLF